MDMNALLKQAKKMQRDLMKAEEELNNKIYNSSVGGAVKIEMNGKAEVTSLQIDSSLLAVENKEELEDMLVMAMNDVLHQMNEDKEKTMGSMTGNIKFPGVF